MTGHCILILGFALRTLIHLSVEVTTGRGCPRLFGIRCRARWNSKGQDRNPGNHMCHNFRGLGRVHLLLFIAAAGSHSHHGFVFSQSYLPCRYIHFIVLMELCADFALTLLALRKHEIVALRQW